MAKFPWLMKIMSEVVWGKLDRKKKAIEKKKMRGLKQKLKQHLKSKEYSTKEEIS